MFQPGYISDRRNNFACQFCTMGSEKGTKNAILTLTFEFGLKVMTFCDKLSQARKFVIANQLLRAGLSIGANVREAQNCETMLDFIHKMKIAGKEAEEVKYYLELIAKAYSYSEISQLLDEVSSINKVLNRIIATSKTKLKQKETPSV